MLVLHQIKVFHDTEGKYEVPNFTHFVIDIIQIHVLLEMIPWNFVLEVSGDPWVL